MKEFLKKYRRVFPFVVALLIFSGIGLIAWFGIVPFQDLITEKANGIQEYYATREGQEQQISKLPELQSQFENITKNEKTLAILLSEKNVVDFVQTLERLAKETGVQVEIHSKTGDIIEEKKSVKAPVKNTAASDTGDGGTVAVKKSAPTILDAVPFGRYLHVEVVVNGEYRTLVTFLHKMETLPIALDVIGMNMKVRDMETSAVLPDNPGRNPFLLFSQGTQMGTAQDIPVQETPAEKIPGNLVASFDTLVYLDN